MTEFLGNLGNLGNFFNKDKNVSGEGVQGVNSNFPSGARRQVSPNNQSSPEIININNQEQTEIDSLTKSGFSSEEKVSLLWLRQFYQTGGSDRAPVIRHLEFLKFLVLRGKLEP